MVAGHYEYWIQDNLVLQANVVDGQVLVSHEVLVGMLLKLGFEPYNYEEQS